MMSNHKIDLSDPETTEAMGGLLAPHLQPGMVIFLKGELGAGKTTWVRGMLRGFGHSGPVKSPTYTLVEPYLEVSLPVYHFDLYRLHDPEELEGLGIRDYLSEDAVCLIEWPERGRDFLPTPDLEIELEYREEERQVTLKATTPRGEQALQRFLIEKSKHSLQSPG